MCVKLYSVMRRSSVKTRAYEVGSKIFRTDAVKVINLNTKRV
jgi:hypothetical protein